MRRIGDPFQAEDPTQEAFISAYTSLHRLSSPTKFGSWLAMIAVNISRTWMRGHNAELSEGSTVGIGKVFPRIW